MNKHQETIASRYAHAFFTVYGNKLTRDNYDALVRAKQKLFHARSPLYIIDNAGTQNVNRERMIFRLCLIYALPTGMDRLLDIMAQSRRGWLMPEVISYIIKLFAHANHFIEFAISSSPDLSQEQKNIFQEFLKMCSGYDIVAHYQIDTRLIAGIKAQSSSLLWHYSIARTLTDSMYALYTRG